MLFIRILLFSSAERGFSTISRGKSTKNTSEIGGVSGLFMALFPLSPHSAPEMSKIGLLPKQVQPWVKTKVK
jgi:hypothetical protein